MENRHFVEFDCIFRADQALLDAGIDIGGECDKICIDIFSIVSFNASNDPNQTTIRTAGDGTGYVIAIKYGELKKIIEGLYGQTTAHTP